MPTNEQISVIRVTGAYLPEIGGSISHIAELSDKINIYLDNQIIITTNTDGCEDHDKRSNIQIIRINIPFIFKKMTILKYIYLSIKVVQRIKEIKCISNISIIHAHGIILGGLISIIKNIYNIKIPLIVMIHGIYPHNVRPLSISYYLEKPLMKIYPPDYIILLNDGTDIKQLESFFEKHTIPYKEVYHGIDTDFFGPTDNKNKVQDSFIVLFPHRPISVKKPELALKIFKEFIKKSSPLNSKLVFLDAKNNLELQDLVIKYELEGLVEFVDGQDRNGVRDYLEKSNVVIGTSLESNMGRAIQEAMASQKPVLVFNKGDMSSLITHMHDGVLINPGDTTEFVNYLTLIYNNPEIGINIGKNARNTIIRERSWKTRIEKEFAIYKKLLK